MRSVLFGPLRKLAARFVADRRGNIAVIFAFATIPLLTLVGAAVDYSRAAAARSAMQSALDSTALMVAKSIATNTLAAADVPTKADAIFKALYKSPDAASVTVTATYTPKTATKNATLEVKGSAIVKTDFMKLVNVTQVPIGSASTTTWGGTRLRVALALDVTGSMVMGGSTKLAEMKKAAKTLIDTLKASAAGKDDVYISIIPFNKMVNVGTTNKTATWLSFNNEYYGSCATGWWDDPKDYLTKTACQNAGKTWTASNKNSWQGCVTDRTQAYDTTKDVPATAVPDTLFPAMNYSDCPESMLAMKSAFEATESNTSTDGNTLKGKINNLDGQGNTNQAIGMHWAWMSLQQTIPLNAPSKDPLYEYTDAIVLMSDGLNTEDRWYDSASPIDARQKILCDKITEIPVGATKPDTLIFTIQVNTNGDDESAVLKYCGKTGGFFSTTTAAGIGPAFQQVGASLIDLRVSK